jgi:hypothetical protein
VVAAHFFQRQLFFIFLRSKTKERQKEMEQKSESSSAMLITVVVAAASCAVATANNGLETPSPCPIFAKGYVPPPHQPRESKKRSGAPDDDDEDDGADDGEEDDGMPQRTKGKKTKTPAEKKQKKYKQTNNERAAMVKEESDAMRLKLKNFKGVLKLKRKCRPVNGGFIEMQCVGCNEWKERTTENFTKDHGGKIFETCAPGHETLRNSAGYPCNTCFATMSSIKRVTPEGYVAGLCHNYPSHINSTSFMEKYNGFGGISPWGGVKMVLKPNAENRASIHNLDNTDETHKNWTIDLWEFNVQQDGDAIPCIETAYTDVYTKMNEIFASPTADDAATTAAHLEKFTTNLKSTPKQNGVTPSSMTDKKLYNHQMKKMHLRTIICRAITNHYHEDVFIAKRMKPVADPKKFKKDLVEKVLALILKQLGKCHYSHIPLTIENLYTRFSLERLDNNKAHFNADGTIPDTTVVVCRLFNVAAQMSRKKLLNYYLNQKLVAVPAEARKRAALEFSTL